MGLRWHSKLAQHVEDDRLQFAHITATLGTFDADVKSRHAENQRRLDTLNINVEKIGAAVNDLGNSVSELIRMKPELEEGILADRTVKDRKAMFRRGIVFLATGATFAATVITLLQGFWGAGIKLTFHFGG